jgi:hypothetical protein
MKKTTLLFILLLLLFGGYFALDSGTAKNWLSGVISRDLKSVREQTLSFLEDIRFKDFQSAARYHSPEDRKKADIPKLIERMFKIKPEFLDIMEYRLLEASLDSSKKRARVKTKIKVNVLNSGKIKNPEIIFYYHKMRGRWYMELESSLR